jgi:DtxR family Mn-dependent transcriptional regulator
MEQDNVESISIQQTASMEDYLKVIAILAEECYSVKVSEIAKALRVKKPSVTSALAKLSEAGLVQHESYGDVVLTAEGAKIGQDVCQRHRTLRQFLVEILNVDPALAEGDACRMEHVVSRMSMERLTKLLDFVLNCPRGEAKWLEGLNYYFEHGKRDEELLARCHREE